MSIELRVDSTVGHASMPLKESAIGILSNAIAKYVRLLLGIYVRKMHSVHQAQIYCGQEKFGACGKDAVILSPMFSVSHCSITSCDISYLELNGIQWL